MAEAAGALAAAGVAGKAAATAVGCLVAATGTAA